tara:strand:+ start:82 stop:756 length:675 start_codon:yes stop_codon:yes gene_type:complete
MNWDLSDKMGGLFIFYLLISGNYLNNLFGCSTRKLLKTNRGLQHLAGFCSLFFFVSIVAGDGGTPNPFEILPLALVMYFFFVLTTRCEHRHLMVIIFLCFILYFTNVYQNYYFEQEEEEPIQNDNPYHNFWPTLQELQTIISYNNGRITPGPYLLTKRITVFIYIIMLLVLIRGMYFYWKNESYRYKPSTMLFKNKNLRDVRDQITYHIQFLYNYWFGIEKCNS